MYKPRAVRVGEREKRGKGRRPMTLAGVDSEMQRDPTGLLRSDPAGVSPSLEVFQGGAMPLSSAGERCFICSPPSHLPFSTGQLPPLESCFRHTFGLYHPRAPGKTQVGGQWSVGEVAVKRGGSWWKREEEPSVCLCPNTGPPVAPSAVVTSNSCVRW